MKVLAVFLISVALASCSPVVSDSQYKAPFPIEFYFNVAETVPSKNLIVSPASVTTCLALAYLGAGGKTAQEFHDTLQFSGTSQNDIAKYYGGLAANFKDKSTDQLKFSVGNRVYVAQNYEIAPTYNELATKYFQSAAENVNFAQSADAAKKINSWIEQETHDKIKNIVEPSAVGATTAAVLVNAIYFKAPWKNPFLEFSTKKQDFFLTKTDKVQVDMMHAVDTFEVADWSHIDATAIRIPYAGSDIYMLIVLPNTLDGLASMEAKFKAANHAQMQTTPVSQFVDFTIPKFKFEFDISLNDVLEKMGLTSMFSDGADFSALLKTPQKIKVSDVKHKAFIAIDEHGTEAAAATTATVVNYSAKFVPSEPRKITVDHPFMFAIRDAGHVYFAGHVVNFDA